MALRLKKDVQKASYYVWFLGAQEARGLRGSRVLLPAIPRLIERSHEQEPLKVTLQVSHKGLKIIQGSSKHFIPHSAITCSVQTDDIVACVLLLYNPATRCPLHVHAYRCDSETTAEALNQQLQILINRPENQKRFSELESRLGLQMPTSTTPTSPKDSPKTSKNNISVISTTTTSSSGVPVSSQRQQFEMSSDTGTSTRESDCGSDEHNQNHSPIMSGQRATLYDDLAAELRAKLNGNGPPILLPPRDYDTMHRSKGNLAAIEMRRCQNQMIVGAPNSKNGAQIAKPNQTIISSRGSSGIGSDLAPSPERRDEGQTSSDEDWTNDHQESVIVMQPPIKRAPVKDPPTKPVVQPVSQYLYPREPPRNEKFSDEEVKKTSAPFFRSSSHNSKEEQKSRRSSVNSREEEEVKPILMKSRPYYDPQRFQNSFRDEDEVDLIKPQKLIPQQRRVLPKLTPEPEFNPISRRNIIKEVEKPESPIKYKKQPYPRGSLENDDGFEMVRPTGNHRENLTDKQKFIAEKQRMSQKYNPDPYREEQESSSLEKFMMKKSSQTNLLNKPRYEEPVVDKEVTYRPETDEFFFERNPYREPESQPYRESIEKMMKSPVMRYKSFDEPEFEEEPQISSRWPRGSPEKRYTAQVIPPPTIPMSRYPPEPRMREDLTPDVSKMKISSKDRFQDAKEKFQQMEKTRGHIIEPMNYNQQKMAKNPVRRSVDNMQMNIKGPAMLVPTKRESIEHIPSNLHSLQRQRSQNSSNGTRNSHRNSRKGSEWSSEDELDRDIREMAPMPVMRGYREIPPQERYPGLDRKEVHSRLAPAKSLGNLVKGYRHSYAEPRHPIAGPTRSSGRVGLAAVNPY